MFLLKPQEGTGRANADRWSSIRPEIPFLFQEVETFVLDEKITERNPMLTLYRFLMKRQHRQQVRDTEDTTLCPPAHLESLAFPLNKSILTSMLLNIDSLHQLSWITLVRPTANAGL